MNIRDHLRNNVQYVLQKCTILLDVYEIDIPTKKHLEIILYNSKFTKKSYKLYDWIRLFGKQNTFFSFMVLTNKSYNFNIYVNVLCVLGSPNEHAKEQCRSAIRRSTREMTPDNGK